MKKQKYESASAARINNRKTGKVFEKFTFKGDDNGYDQTA